MTMREGEDSLNENFTLEQWFNHTNPQVPNLEGFCGPGTQWDDKVSEIEPICWFMPDEQLILNSSNFLFLTLQNWA